MNIAVIGAGECDSATYQIALSIGAGLALHSVVLVCGGLGGVMEAAARGAFEAGGITIGILPQSDRSGANRYLTAAIPTGLGAARNFLVVTAADALIAIGGKYGTLSEIAFALNLEKPVIGLSTWAVTQPDVSVTDPIIRAVDADDAVTKAIEAAGQLL